MSKVIKLYINSKGKRHCVLLSSRDKHLTKYKWSISQRKSKNAKIFYCARFIKNSKGIYTTSYLHREILINKRYNNKNKLIVDHINRNTLDNRRENLRLCTHKENAYNTKKIKYNNLPIGIVNTGKPRKYRVQIWKNYKPIILGSYSCKKIASFVYDIRCMLLREDFSVLNNEIGDIKTAMFYLGLSNTKAKRTKRKK